MAAPLTRPSFLQDVLESAGKAEMTDLKERIAMVTQNINQLKGQVHEHMRDVYITFDPLMKRDKLFVEQAKKLSNEVNELFSRIENQTKCDLASSTGELRSLHSSLKEVSLMVSLTSYLVDIDNGMRETEKAQSVGHFLEAATHLNKVQGLLKNAPHNADMLDMYRAVKKEYGRLWEALTSQMMEILRTHLSLDEVEMGNKVKHSSVKVVTSQSPELVEVVQALHMTEMLQIWIPRFSKHLMRSLLLPLIRHNATVSLADHESFSTLQAAIEVSSSRPDHSVVFSNLTKCFEFLHGELDITFEGGTSFMRLLGEDSSEEFCEVLIKDCLNDTVPDSTVKIENFSEVMSNTQTFFRYISGIGFLAEGDQLIMDFVRNVNVLCANKTCQVHLEKARNIMKKDLHDMLQVGPLKATEELNIVLNTTNKLSCAEETTITSCTEERTITMSLRDPLSEPAKLKPHSQLNPNTFQFPKCCISKSTLELLDLVYNVLEEAVNTTDTCFLTLFSTARKIFELYKAVVPMYHAKFLNTIPQQVALFHNNCMFLAHRLLVFGFELEGRLRPIMKRATASSGTNSVHLITFVDIVQSLRYLGTDTFLKQMQLQRKQILDIIKDSGLASLGENPKLTADTEKPVRQCLRQLELLQTVWEDVLPSNVYEKAIGCLLNAFLEELIVRVSSVEDIPADTATVLVTVFKMVAERAPALFKEENSVHMHVRRWLKFQELIIILGASLREIEERWAVGKGPLAHEFSVEQVKQLVRALFQNTTRRAEVLAKIK